MLKRTSRVHRPRPAGRRASSAAVAVLLGVVGVTVVAGPARADGYGGTECEQQSATASCTALAGTTGARPKASGTKQCHNSDGGAVPCSIAGKGWYSAQDGCYYRPASAGEAPGKADAGSRWFLGTCGNPVAGFNTQFAALRQFQTAPGPETVAQQAITMLRLPSPVIRMSPAADTLQVVRVPSWLWVGSETWRARTATAAAGGVVVTATARPTQAVWSTGDGDRVTCGGPGTPWSRSTNPAAASPTCGHTYTRPSPAASGFRVQATITWAVTWTGAGAAAGAAGVAGPLTSTATVPVRVVQSSAVNVADGSAAEAVR